MEFEEAHRLRIAWGNKPCDHPSIEEEYFQGIPTGDYVCVQCGKDIPQEPLHDELEQFLNPAK